MYGWAVQFGDNARCVCPTEEEAKAIAAALAAMEASAQVEYYEYVESSEVAQLEITADGYVLSDLPTERVEVKPETLVQHFHAQDLLKEAVEAMEKIT
jgi:hypothetical protein